MKKLFSILLLITSFLGFSQQITLDDFIALQGKSNDDYIKDISHLFYVEKGFELIKMEEVSKSPICYSYFLTNDEPFNFIVNSCSKEYNQVIIFSNSSILYDNYLLRTKLIGEYLSLGKIGNFDLFVYKISEKLQIDFSKVVGAESKEIIYLVRLHFVK